MFITSYGFHAPNDSCNYVYTFETVLWKVVKT